MVPQPGQPRPFATLPGDRKWYPLYPDTRLENLTEAEASVIGARCDKLAEQLGYRGVEFDRPRIGSWNEAKRIAAS
jgi:hypothetical protein